MNCPDETTFSELIAGHLSTDQALEIDAHADGCVACRTLMVALANTAEVDATVFRPASEPLAEAVGPPLRRGELVGGKYKVGNTLGTGGMGVVVAAVHQQLGQKVALKMMLPSIAGIEEARARFLREARAACRLRSEHVARVLDVGTHGSNTPYIVMEYLEGSDLAAVLRQRGPIPPGEAVAFVLQALEGVAEAHAAGIVHRDLKPANLFLTRTTGGTACVKVLDFGLSKLSDPSFPGSFAGTQSSTLMGSPVYMAPEQLTAVSVDARVDVWAMGCILYELLSARIPFEAPTLPELVTKILHGSPAELRGHAPLVPEALARVVHQCLVPAQRRIADVGVLAHELAPFTAEGERSALRVAATLGRPNATITPRPERSVRWAIAAAVALAGGLVLARALRTPVAPSAPLVTAPSPLLEAVPPPAAQQEAAQQVAAQQVAPPPLGSAAAPLDASAPVPARTPMKRLPAKPAPNKNVFDSRE
jgi:hypothetical protein